jgi:hypothetical protein
MSSLFVGGGRHVFLFNEKLTLACGGSTVRLCLLIVVGYEYSGAAEMVVVRGVCNSTHDMAALCLSDSHMEGIHYDVHHLSNRTSSRLPRLVS